MEAFQEGGAGCVREKTPSGGNAGILAFADHLHAHKPLEHNTGKEKNPKKQNRSSLTLFLIFVGYLFSLSPLSLSMCPWVLSCDLDREFSENNRVQRHIRCRASRDSHSRMAKPCQADTI